MTIPNYLEWDSIGLCGIVGKSGSGKSSTLRLLMSQLALGGRGIILVDGHGTQGSETLAQTCAPLSAAFVVEPAVKDEDIYNAIKLAYDIGQNRIAMNTGAQNPIALVVDEFANILVRFSRADMTRAKEIVSMVQWLATEARKTNVKTFLAAQNWTAEFIGAAAIRKSMNVTIIHRVAPDDAKLFTTLPQIKRDVANLRAGQAWVLGFGDPVRTYLPKVSQDDLSAISHRVIEFEADESVSNALGSKIAGLGEDSMDVESVSSALESNSGVSGLSVSNEIYVKTIIAKMQHVALQWDKNHEKPITKAQLIYETLNIAPGRSKPYAIAGKIYEFAKRHKYL